MGEGVSDSTYPVVHISAEMTGFSVHNDLTKDTRFTFNISLLAWPRGEGAILITQITPKT